MTTKLDAALKREVEIAGALYTLTITPERLTLVPKGRRKGYELAWEALVSGDAALAQALNASLTVRPAEPVAKPSAKAARDAKKTKRTKGG